MEIESNYEVEFEELRRQSLNERRTTRTMEEEEMGIQQIEELLNERSDFKEKYIKAFQLIAGPDCKRISWQSGLKAWKLLLANHNFPHLQLWYEFVETNHTSITKDLWLSFRDFLEFDENFTNFDTNGAFPSAFDDFVSHVCSKLNKPEPTPSSLDPTLSSSSSKSSYVGLFNQGATCYLNSLLQTLFMTPEFRSHIFNLNKKTSFSIAKQLQLLFYHLATSQKNAISTVALTNSFGFDQNAVFTQHDVQELCRVLFENVLEEGTGTFINDLYQGKMNDNVTCNMCNIKKTRGDLFLDLSLDLRPTLYESLAAYSSPEIIGDFKCENCGSIGTATKSLEFNEFPYILMLHLKRFGFENERRFKISKYVDFPLWLDTTVVGGKDSVREKLVSEISTLEMLLSETTQDLQMKQYFNSEISNKKEQLSSRKYTHELFSVLMHSGSAQGGHYYAYIKSFEKNSWFKFNDSHVTPIEEYEVHENSGGNAYLLFYRKIDSEKNISSVSVPEIDFLQDEIQVENNYPIINLPRVSDVTTGSDLEMDDDEEEEEEPPCFVKVYVSGNFREFSVDVNEKVKKFRDSVIETFKIKNDVNCLRFRDFDAHKSVMGKPYEMKGYICETFEFEPGEKYVLCVEIKKEDENFKVYNSKELLLRVVLYKEMQLEPPIDVFAVNSDKVFMLKEVLEGVFLVDRRKMRLFVKKSNDIIELEEDNKVLTWDYGLFNGTTVYLEVASGFGPPFASQSVLKEQLREVLLPQKQVAGAPIGDSMFYHHVPYEKPKEKELKIKRKADS